MAPHDMPMQAERVMWKYSFYPFATWHWKEEGDSNAMQLLYPQDRRAAHYTGHWVGLGAGQSGTENLAAIGIRFSDRPTCNKSL
jgi:hypothetical protein